MPQVTVYIRNEDLGRWKALQNKSEHIHNLLNMKDSYLGMAPVERKVVKERLKDLGEELTELSTPIIPDPTPVSKPEEFGKIPVDKFPPSAASML